MHRRLAFVRSHTADSPAETDPAARVMRALRNGEPALWQAWVAAYSPQFYTYVLYNTHAEADAQQLLESALALVTKTILQSEYPFDLTILTVSAIYQALLRYQQRCGAPTLFLNHLQVPTAPLQDQFVALLGKLSLPDRHLLLLRYVVGLNLVELEAVTGKSPNRITTLLQKATDHFRSLL